MCDYLLKLLCSARVFQNTQCSACEEKLDLPAVHFFCKHSYHQRCLSAEVLECPICAPKRKDVEEAQTDAESKTKQIDFADEVILAQDPWDVVVKHLA